MTVECSSQHTDDEGDPSSAVRAELVEANRQARADLRKQLAEAEQTLGELEHSAEERMLSVADLIPDSQNVRRRAHQLSTDAGTHLARAASRRSKIDKSSTDSDRENGGPRELTSG